MGSFSRRIHSTGTGTTFRASHLQTNWSEFRDRFFRAGTGIGANRKTGSSRNSRRNRPCHQWFDGQTERNSRNYQFPFQPSIATYVGPSIAVMEPPGVSRICHHFTWSLLDLAEMDGIDLDWTKFRSPIRTFQILARSKHDLWRNHADVFFATH